MTELSDKIKPEDLREGYRGWNPFEDSMTGRESWNKTLEFESWKDFRSEFIPFDPDYNQIVDFYFERYKPAKNCESCDGRGYSPRALEIEAELYERLGVERESFERLTEEERKSLQENGRPLDGALGLDSLSMGVLVRYHTKTEGANYSCGDCQGDGSIVTGDERLGLNLWMTHPRKGASRGVYIATVQEDDLPEVYALLNDMRDRLVARFKNVPASTVKIDYEKGFPDIASAVMGHD